MTRSAPLWSSRPSDWLLDPSPFTARIRQTDDRREVVLENGLVRRVIRLEPDAATIAFDDLRTGAALIRSVLPEAIVVVNGRRWEVGGLGGQEIHNFLDARTIDGLRADPTAFRCTGCMIGATEAPFPWQPRPTWMAGPRPWPLPGRSLTLTFASPGGFGAPPAAEREVLCDPAPAVAGGWTAALSDRHPRTSVCNEGKAGEILARESTHACLERPWPAGAVSVSCLVDTGTDRGGDMSPGLAIDFPHGRLKLNVRPNSGTFGVFYCESLRACGSADPGRPHHLKVSLRDGQAVCEASADGRAWTVLDALPCSAIPLAVRIGKTSRGGRAASPCSVDNPEADGQLVRCRIGEVRFLGPAPEPAAPVRDSATVEVRYEIYDGLPLVSKRISVINTGETAFRLDSFTAELLAITETESLVESPAPGWAWVADRIHVETDFAFHGMSAKAAQPAVHRVRDRTYQTQVSYNLETPCRIECRPPFGPAAEVPPGGRFDSFRIFELVLDSDDRERTGLSLRRMYRAIAPWTAENPLMMHVVDASPEAVRLAVDQCAEAGFDLLIMSFLSGFDWESRKPAYQESIRELCRYAEDRGVALGGYSLLASRSAADAADNCCGGSPTYGVMPCLGSAWGRDYLDQLRRFADATGLAALEHDGSYPGDTCASQTHPFHRGLDDSQWVQWRAITGLYQWARARGMYLNIPDWYFLSGGSKTGMGYRETNWSLPRPAQAIIERQNIFDGTWEKTASMGWMFVPLTEYHGGGANATLEPLDQNHDHYRQRLANLFGAGVMALFRGRRLFDGPRTLALVRAWVSFYRAHREVLDGDIIHLRRADGRDLDGILHVNPGGREQALLMLYNPLDQTVQRTITVPLYYAGLAATARVEGGDGTLREVATDRSRNAELTVTVPAQDAAWYVFRA